uniref:Crumbs cell polarity complex component 1 n=1 Tax=Electrophorus electricus TaxID=8005 RepID=A0A4W4HBJ6_ELEEL
MVSHGFGVSGSFIGCMRDLFVDSHLMGPDDWLNASAVNITRGCIHRDRCKDAPCENRGECVNLWQGYQCKCQRPYEGQNCADEHTPARFGRDGASSFAVFAIDEEPGAAVLTFSMLLRTRRESGMLLALAAGARPYLWVRLEHGHLKAKVDGAQGVAGRGVISDGKLHLVSVAVGWGQMTLRQSGLTAGRAAVGPVHVRAGDKVYVGGVDDKRSTAGLGGYFEGCIQDLRLNEQRLQFFPRGVPVRSHGAEHMVNVSEGCIGGDSCASSPCQNGGVCVPAWEDFTCACTHNATGRHCEEVRWCAFSLCPSPAHCRPVPRGYECISNVTFQNGVTLTFRGNGLISRHLTTISFSIRTRQHTAAVLHADSGSGFVTVSVRDGLLVLELLSPSSSSSSSSSSPVADGMWHNVEFRMVAPAANASQWALLLADDREEPVTSDSEAGNLDFLREGVDILLGGPGSRAGQSGIMCLSNVELGGIVLSYYGPSDLMLPRPQMEQFRKTSTASLPGGCRAEGGACEPSLCLNGGHCRDLLGPFRCTCPSGWTGQRCELHAVACRCEAETDPCGRRRCADGATASGPHGGVCLIGSFSFNFFSFLSPPRGSKLPASICGHETQNYTCLNGGNCSDADFACDCLPGFTGHRSARLCSVIHSFYPLGLSLSLSYSNQET